MRASGASSRSPRSTVALPPESTELTISSNCSNWVRLAMSFTHALAQTLNRAKLQLLHGSLGASHRFRDFADPLLLRKSHLDYMALIRWQVPHEPVKRGAVFYG